MKSEENEEIRNNKEKKVWCGLFTIGGRLQVISIPSPATFDAEEVPCPLGRRKLAVVVSGAAEFSTGMGRFPSAIPQIDVMCVSGPKTYNGIPLI